jgi:hypothetical protein
MYPQPRHSEVTRYPKTNDERAYGYRQKYEQKTLKKKHPSRTTRVSHRVGKEKEEITPEPRQIHAGSRN